MSTPAGVRPAMTPRMIRGLQLSAREEELRGRRSELDRQRAAHRQRNLRSPDLDAQARAVRVELRRLAAERKALLARIEEDFARLRPRQAEFDRARAAALAAGRRRPPLGKEEQRLRKRLAILQRERAYVDGTVHRDRGRAKAREDLWNACPGEGALTRDGERGTRRAPRPRRRGEDGHRGLG